MQCDRFFQSRVKKINGLSTKQQCLYKGGVLLVKNESTGKQRILVTGGSGFIGAPLCAELVVFGYEVWVLTRNVVHAARRLGSAVKVVSQLHELDGLEFLAVINLVGESLGTRRWTAASKVLFRQSRVDFTRALYDFFAGQGLFPRVLINASAVGVYGNAGSILLDESAAAASDYAATLCRDWELAAEQFSSSSVRVCVVRIGIVLDREGGALKQILPAFSFGLGGRMGDGKHYMSWIYRHDLVRLLIFLVRRDDALGVFNAVAPAPVTNREFTRLLAAALNRPAFLPMPRLMLRLLFGEMADALLLSSQRVVPKRIQSLGFTFECPDLQCAFDKILNK